MRLSLVPPVRSAQRQLPGLRLPPAKVDAESTLKRFEKARSKKEQFNTILDEIYSLFMPNRNRFDGTVSPGQEKNRDALDSTPVKAASKLAGRLQSVLYPAFREWVKLEAGSDTPKDQRRQVDEALEEQTEILFDHINASNFATAAHEATADLITGTASMQVQDGRLEEPLEFNAIPLSEVVPEEGPNGLIETNFRERKVCLRDIKRLWPRAELPEQMQRRATDNPTEEVCLVEGCVYDYDTNSYQYCVIEKGDKAVLFQERMSLSPIITFRWSKLAGETLGRGPCFDALPSARTLNYAKSLVFRHAESIIAPPILTDGDNGQLNPGSFDFSPGYVNVVNNIDRIREFVKQGRIDLAMIIAEEERTQIREAMYVSKTSPGEGAVRSATEWVLAQKELLDDIGGQFPRLYGEFLFRLVRQASAILVRRGKMAPIKVDGRDVTVRFVGPLAQAQDQDDILSIQRFLEVMAPLGQPLTMLTMRAEDLGEEVADKTGFPKRLVRSAEERKQIQQVVAQMVAAQQQAAQAGGGPPAA